MIKTIQSSRFLLFPLALAFYEISTYLSNDMYLPALPNMMKDLSLSSKQVQFTLTTWFIGLASLPLFLGILSDRIGRRTVLLGGGVVYIIATIVCAITNHHAILLIARFVEGGMAASMMVAGYAAVHELYHHKEAVRILAIMGSISVLAPTLGPLVGSIILLFTSWRGIFWLIAIWAAVAILILIKVMPETLKVDSQNKIEINKLLKSYLAIFLNFRFMSLMCILGCIFAGFITWITAGSLLVVNTFHHSIISFGVIQMVIFMSYIIGTRSVSKFLNKFTVYRLIQIGMTIALSGCFVMLILNWLLPNNLYGFIMGMIVFSYGAALCFSPLNRLIIESSMEPMGIKVALFTVFLTAFSALGSAISGLFFTGTIQSLTYLVGIFVMISYIIKLVFENLGTLDITTSHFKT